MWCDRRAVMVVLPLFRLLFAGLSGMSGGNGCIRVTEASMELCSCVGGVRVVLLVRRSIVAAKDLILVW